MERRRFGASLLTAALICAASSAAAISVTSGKQQKKEEEELLQIEFRQKPPEPPPPPVPEMPAAPAPAPEPPKPKERPKPPPKLKTPTEMPDKKLAESDAPLPDLPVGGINGVPGGTAQGSGQGVAAPKPPPPPPPPKPAPVKVAPLVTPVPASTPRPRYSAMARRKGIEGVVVATFEVLENGTVGNVKIVSGPEELRETVIKSLATWRFKPAQRGGQPVRYRMQQVFRFNLQDA